MSDAAAQAEAGPSQEPARGEHIAQAGEQRSARVESLRALAALSVLGGHVLLYVAFDRALTADLPIGSGVLGHAVGDTFDRIVYAGTLGVFFFFALTGYLLFWPFAKQHFGGADRIDLRNYALNRALRILPLYFAVVIILLLIQEDGGRLGQWARFLTFTENFSSHTIAKVDPPIWSLVVELHFYILLPLIAYVLARLTGGSRQRAAVVLLAAGAAAIALRWVTYLEPTLPSPLWHRNLPGTFWFFVPGMLLALLRLAWEERRPSWLRGPIARADLWLLASLPIWALVVIAGRKADPLVGVAAFLIIGGCVLPLTVGPLSAALEWRPLAVVGIASYSLYLWHVPLINALRKTDGIPDDFWGFAAIAAPLAIAVALVSYVVIEAPFLRLRRQWARSAAPKATQPPRRAAVAETDAGPGS